MWMCVVCVICLTNSYVAEKEKLKIKKKEKG